MVDELLEYVASISYGKDSLAMLEVIHQNKLPLTRIIHAEIWATKDIPADLPPMVDFKNKADKIILDRYGIEVERVSSDYTFEEIYHRIRKRGKYPGKMYGFPNIIGSWCVSELKQKVLKKHQTNKGIQYIGYAYDEPKRHGRIVGNKKAPLVDYKITEREAMAICESLDLVSPIYTDLARGGCWFCNKQRLGSLRLLKKNYNYLWQLLLKWGSDFNDRCNTFTRDKTIFELEQRFDREDRQQRLF